MLIPQSNELNDYLGENAVIDHQHPDIVQFANDLANGSDNDLSIAKRCFEYVRDEIKHTSDYGIDIITCKASDVLLHKTGFCYAKSHLLAALLGANNIPAGLCYQRLSISGDEDYASLTGEPYCLHGLNAIYLSSVGWYRVDSRGNKSGVDAQFDPPTEKLAFELNDVNEVDGKMIYVQPLEEVIDTLLNNDSLANVNINLPDTVMTTL